METIRQVIDQEVISPRQLNGAVPKDLETICLKCLQKNPHARYDSAEQVAGDLTRYLEGRPIVARPIGSLERIWRWCRRNRAVAALLTLVAALLVLGTVGSTIVAFQMRTARDRIADAKTAADAQKIKAQQAEEATIAEFEASTDDGIELLIGSKPSLSEQERTYLERTLKRWQAFADRAEDDERTLQIRADAHFRLGDLWSRLDRRDEAMREYPRALEIRKRLVARFPDSLQHRRDLANAHNNYGIVLKDLGEHDRALEQYEEALRIRQEIVKQQPEDGDYKLELASSFNNLGVLSRGLGQYDASQQWFERAIANLHELNQRFPDVNDVSTRLARAHQNLADVFFKMGQRERSLEEYDQGRTVLAKLASENPSNPELQRALASLTSDIGVFLASAGQPDEAIKEYQTAREIQEDLAQQYPSIPTYRVELGRTHNNLGKTYHVLQRYDDALRSLREASKLRLALVSEFPGIPLYDCDLARTYFNLGLVLASQSKYEEARDPFEQAYAIQTRLVDTVDNGSTYLQDVARTGTMLAGLAALRGDFAAARRSYQDALAIQRDLIQRFPNSPEHLLHCGATCWNIGTMCKEEGNLPECLTWADEAIDLLQQAHDRMGDDRDTLRQLKAVYILKADTLGALGRYQESASVWEQAAENGNAGERLVFSAREANSLVRAGQVTEAVALADELIKHDVWPADELYNLACLYAVASVKINEGAEFPADQRASMSKGYAGKALDMLKQIATKSEDFFATDEGRRLLATDEDLDVLRSRDDFREFAASLGVELPAATK
jgi:tetratricopeptide (TPR) repeat protein